jgi:hypothetical protein
MIYNLIQAILAFIALVAGGFLLAPTGCSHKVYELHGVRDPAKAFNVLILGDGFVTDDDLQSYRKAAEDLTGSLFRDPLFQRWAEAINVYRMDVRSTTGVSVASCPAVGCSVSALAAPPPVAPQVLPVNQNTRGLDVAFGQLQSEVCWKVGAPPGLCNALWMDGAGQAAALELALEPVDIDVVVVLANVWNVAGGGLQDALLPTTPGVNQRLGLAVAGVPSTSTGVLTAQAVELLSHELGHTLGLLDEYETMSGYPPSPAATDRNVWIPDAADQCWVPDFGKTQTPSSVPWSALLTCAWTPLCDCGMAAAAGTCGQPWVPRDIWPFQNPCCGTWSTPYVPASCTDERLLPCSSKYVANATDACLVHPGLWEGANYSKTGAFRARLNCRMRGSPDRFCEACGLVVDRTLAPFGPPLP